MTTSTELWHELQRRYDGRIPPSEMNRLRALEAAERAEQSLRDHARLNLMVDAMAKDKARGEARAVADQLPESQRATLLRFLAAEHDQKAGKPSWSATRALVRRGLVTNSLQDAGRNLTDHGRMVAIELRRWL